MADPVYCEFICGGCGARAPGIWCSGCWLKPKGWYDRADQDGPQVACSAPCIAKVAARSQKTSTRLPI